MMKSDLSLTKKSFDELLAWLDPDPRQAGEKYERIRKRLIMFFLNRQYYEAEDLADDTINRVAKKPEEWKHQYVGEPANYFYAVAKNIVHEQNRRRMRNLEPPPEPSREELEPYLECLDNCLAELPVDHRELILPYYENQRSTKIASRKQIGTRFGLNAGALRARIHRIRIRLRACVEGCVGNVS